MPLIRPIIRHITCDNVFEDLRKYRPPDPHAFSLQLSLAIGSQDDEDEAADNFYIIVGTPKWLESAVADGDIVNGRHKLFIREYDIDRILKYMEDYVASCVGTTWEDVAVKIGRSLQWEFEDYQERKPET
jgi:hypothetical protein